MHDFKNFPELTNSQMDLYYFESPHKQILSDFKAKVVKVHDGDTITLRWDERDFDFPLRMLDIAAPELDSEDGEESQEYLEEKLLNEEVDIIIDPNNRVEKWGRLLGRVYHMGQSVSEESILAGHAKPWEQRKDVQVSISMPDFSRELDKWA